MGYRLDLVKNPQIFLWVILASVILSAVNILSDGGLFGYENSFMSFISMFTWSLFISLILVYVGILCIGAYRNLDL